MGRQTIARVFFPQIRTANKSPDHFFSSLNAISMSHSSKRHGIGQWRRIYQSLWIIIQIALSSYLPSLLPFLSRKRGTKGVEIRFDPESWHCGSFEISLRRTMETEEALPGASRCSPFRRVARFFPHRPPRGSETAGSTAGRRSARKRDKFQERLLLRKGGGEKGGRGLEFALTSDALSAVWKVSRPRESFTWSCNKRPWTGDKIERRNSAAKLQRIVSSREARIEDQPRTIRCKFTTFFFLNFKRSSKISPRRGLNEFLMTDLVDFYLLNKIFTRRRDDDDEDEKILLLFEKSRYHC